ncbi:AAA family ATPase [Clostridium perfringens]|uniref:AAA family ATPase n=1 Tax=Clostridium perfringens TaxID=1502 RepID=UPI001ABBE1BB|nr:AAA family ATPase [Clostridium perfringens]MBO3361376.1 AAA family ATPase [Clostridium perfringens]HBI6884536.1 AAA family ATPase [Clostridium perfringens]
MFTYIILKNYKSFKDVKVDFTDKKGNPKSLICIYGENGSGKSNIASAIHFLKEIASTRMWLDEMNIIMEKINNVEAEGLPPIDLVNIFKDKFRDIESIIKTSKLIGSKEPMELEFGIKIDSGDGVYNIKLNDTEIIEEKLEFTLNYRKAVYFQINKKENIELKLNKSVFFGNQYKLELETEIKKYWGKHSFMSILLYQLKEKNSEFINNNINQKMLDYINFLYNISTKCLIGDKKERGFVGYESNILANIDEGEIEEKYLEELSAIEVFLCEIFTALYSDIKNVYYKVKKNENNKYNYKLIFKKMIFGELIDIEYNLESTGTLSILNIIPYMVNCINKKVVVLDEIDTGIHDILFKNLINSIKDCINGQFIMTTHNTYIMEEVLEPQNIYVIYVDACGNKEIRCLEDFNKIRIRNSNNLRLRYIKGIYGGIPEINEVDFEFACNDLLERLEGIKSNEV